jgi:hypothetical protein
MKLVTMAFLLALVLSNSMLAVAEGPVPLRTLMQPAGAEPTMNASQDQSSGASAKPAHRPMTSRGKVMTGVGIGLCAVGGAVIIGAVALNGAWGFSSSDKAAVYGAGGGALAGGVVLVVLGDHSRK